MSERKGPETQDNMTLDTQSEEEEEGEETGTEGNNESEPIKDVIESDQAVEPDVKVAEELKALHEKEDMVTAYTAAKTLIPESTISKKRQRQRRQRQRRQEKETTALINISKQLDKQTTEIKRISSVLQHIQKQTSQIQKYVTKKKNTT
jgi:hypothetical protein